MFAGSVSAGGVVSTTVTVNVLVDELACASTAVHVTVVAPIAKVDPEAGVQLATPAPSTASLVDQFTVVVPSGKVGPEAGVQVGVSAPSTMSAAEALKVTAAPAELVASVVMFAGTVTAGGVVSRTVTVNAPVLVLPWVSAALQLTVVVPIGKVDPDTVLQVTGRRPSTMSAAVAL